MTYGVVFQKVKLQEESACFPPMDLFERLDFFLEGGCVLESSLQEEHTGRYSFLAFEPIGAYEVFHDEIRETINGETEWMKGDPFKHAPLFLKKFQSRCSPEIESLVTHSIGFITYDAIRYIEKIPDRHPRDEALPEFLLKVYQTTLCVDHQDQSLLISTLAALGEDHQEAYSKARHKIEKAIQHITMASSDRAASCSCSTQNHEQQDLSTEMNDEAFIALVKAAQEEIKKGEIFQIVLSRSVRRSTSLTPFSLYVALSEVSPAPYLFYLPLADRVIMGASPECMLRLSGKKITINPIAGTRSRRAQDGDRALEEELFGDPKELAEHRMLVDLGRNDLGRACKVGSVEVEELLKVKHYSHVSHLTSQISGILRESYDFWDALQATFPAGTLSGAPKIRAMELIDQWETSRRGLYGGVILRLDHAGNGDSCIAIRMLTLKQGVATIRTGAGIVHDSIPSHEAAETHYKAHSILAAIAAAEKKGGEQ